MKSASVEPAGASRRQLRGVRRHAPSGARACPFAARPGHPARRAIAAAVLFAFVACGSAAELAVPALTGRVVDQAGILGGDAARVEAAIQGLERTTDGQMAVLILPTLGGDALEPFSMRVAEAWKIGRKGKDNGALLVIVRDSRGLRLDIGYGWEGSINDARAGDIIRGMGPFFRAGRFGDGCVYAVRQVEGYVSGKPPAGLPATPAGAAPPRARSDGYLHVGGMRIHPLILFSIWIIFIVVIGSVFGKNRGRTYGGRSYGGWSGGSSSGGGFSGGGGSFGGGGASGSW
ncbi:MAG: TPM domain-containing protein [bacterium]